MAAGGESATWRGRARSIASSKAQSRGSNRGSRGFVTVSVVVLVLAGIVAVTLGAPEHSELLNLVSGHGWLTDDANGDVVLANGQTGHVDYRDIVTNNGDPIEVVQTSQASVLLDQKTGEAGTLDLTEPSNQQQAQTESPLPGDGSGSVGTSADATATNELVPTSGASLFDIHRRTGVVSVLDPFNDNRQVASARIGGRLSTGIVDQHGTLWLESNATGAMVGLRLQGSTLHVQKVANSAVGPGDNVEMSDVNGNPAVLDTRRGVFFVAPNGVPGSVVDIPTGIARDALIAPAITGGVVPLGSTGVVTIIRGSSANPVHVAGAENDNFGPPVPYHSRIYVPDLRKHDVLVLSDSGQSIPDLPPIYLPGGETPFDVAIQNGSLFIDDPHAATALSVLPNGQTLLIDKAEPNVPTNRPSIPIPAPAAPSTLRLNNGAPTNSSPTGPVVAPGKGNGPIVAATAPTAPTGVVAQPGDGQATVNWSPPDDDGSSITGYTISWASGDGGSQHIPGNTDSYLVSGLTNGQTYTFSVTATNAVGTGPAGQAQAVTPSSQIPGAPQDVTATGLKDGSIQVKWQAASGNGHQITGYTITAKGSDGSVLTPVTSTGSDDSATLDSTDGIVIGTSYTFTVTATNDIGNVGPISQQSDAVIDSSTPLAVTGLVKSAGGRGTATIVWDCDSTCANGAAVTQFAVSVSPTPSSVPTSPMPAASGTAQRVSLTGLQDGTPYKVTVAAINKNGQGQSANVPFTTESSPTVASYTQSTSGLTITVNFTVNYNGTSSAGSSCSITNLSDGLAGPSGSCSSLTVSVPTYNSAYTGTLNVLTADYGTTAVQNLNLQSGYKVLLADAGEDYGNTYVASKAQSGPNSNTCSSPGYSAATCGTVVVSGSQVTAVCWTPGTEDDNLDSTVSTPTYSTVWIEVTNGFAGYMNSMWFNPGVTPGATSTDPSTSPAAQNLPQC